MTSSTPTHEGQRHQGRRLLPKFKGVRRRRWGRWVAEIRVPSSRDRLWLGSYATAHQAARAYDVAAACLRGSSAVLNLPSLPLPSAQDTCLSPASIRKLAAQEAARLSSHYHDFLHADNFESAASFPPPDIPLDSGSLPAPVTLSEDHRHGDLGSSPCDACLDVHSHSEQQPAPATDDESPSPLDLWFCLDLSPTVGPHLKDLLTRSLYPEKDNNQESY
ncbi:hypothetical protein GOP47_0010863 [Adiantum capillus-veneris]|uniref:AP2/ERF domain-containing protein n=1 Tax=Adiantum capillus-veneris TaxID=13818 RepID=A0A9D4ZI81_ADICA|nr:hypothetical protein GOP47_0010863 [Adiantum capillus-veneris]